MATFALVHGAWHGGWAWEALALELEGRGHRVVAPDLPCEDVEAGVAKYAELVSQALGADRDAVVVGHSLGGLTIPLVPARLHVYLCAYVPEPGHALVDRPPEAFGPGLAGSLLRDELDRSYWPDPVAAARGLQYPPEAAEMASRLRPQAHRPSVEPSPLAALPQTPRACVVGSTDHVIPPAWQRRRALSELGVEPVELTSGHSPMLSHPRELGAILDRLARVDG
jgi:pimeloyl-ACP methyl ester carboxylesterase